MYSRCDLSTGIFIRIYGYGYGYGLAMLKVNPSVNIYNTNYIKMRKVIF